MTAHIGVFVCDCKGLVSDHVDTSRLAEEISTLGDVAFVERKEMLCGESDLGDAVRQLKERGCDRMLFAGCSPRSSLKFPEERIARVMASVGLEPDLFEVANIREQCAWQHSDREAATNKAIDLVRMAHARLETDEPAPVPVPIAQRALVIGGGAAGLQTAKDLASAGIEVTLTERNPWLGGHLCQLSRIFQSEAWPSVCDSSCVGPVQAKGVMLGEGIRALTQTEVVSADRSNGSFRVTMRKRSGFRGLRIFVSPAGSAPRCAPRRPCDGSITARVGEKRSTRSSNGRCRTSTPFSRMLARSAVTASRSAPPKLSISKRSPDR